MKNYEDLEHLWAHRRGRKSTTKALGHNETLRKSGDMFEFWYGDIKYAEMAPNGIKHFREALYKKEARRVLLPTDRQLHQIKDSSMKPATEVILSAAFALTPRRNWVQNHDAVDSSGTPVLYNNPNACRFCMAGALMAAGYELEYRIFDRIQVRDALFAATGSACVTDWNDDPKRKHSEVLEALYKAAEIAEAA